MPSRVAAPPFPPASKPLYSCGAAWEAPQSQRRFRRLRAGTRSFGPGPEVYDYRGQGTPSHRLGRIHPYVRSCSATGTDRELTGGPESVRDG